MAGRIPAEIRTQLLAAVRQSSAWLAAKRNRAGPSVEGELARQLYATWYAASEGKVADPDLRAPSIAGACRAAHAGTWSWEAGWTITNVLPDGSILAARGADTRRLQPGDYIPEDLRECLPRPGHGVTCVTRRDEVSSGYWLTWSAAWHGCGGRIVRLYWNVHAAGAPALVRHVTQSFGELPFALKVPAEAVHFDRPDAVVLYVPAVFFVRRQPMLRRIHAFVHATLAPGVPRLTRRLASGLSAAESPRDGRESFGQKRCRLIASALSRLPAGAAADEALGAISASFARAGIPVERPWLEPWGARP